MVNVKNDGYYIQKIIDDARFLIKHTENLTIPELQKDEVLQDCIMFRLVQISENSSKLTDDFKNRNKHILWSAIKGLRNRIVHDYGQVDITVIYDTVITDIPQLLKQLNEI